MPGKAWPTIVRPSSQWWVLADRDRSRSRLSFLLLMAVGVIITGKEGIIGVSFIPSPPCSPGSADFYARSRTRGQCCWALCHHPLSSLGSIHFSPDLARLEKVLFAILLELVDPIQTTSALIRPPADSLTLVQSLPATSPAPCTSSPNTAPPAPHGVSVSSVPYSSNSPHQTVPSATPLVSAVPRHVG